MRPLDDAQPCPRRSERGLHGGHLGRECGLCRGGGYELALDRGLLVPAVILPLPVNEPVRGAADCQRPVDDGKLTRHRCGH
uniref:Uncharacterized protein n=1 Tax=uncultured marine virus TaxID=186617 RepID=A0A0F7L2B7_9VIRU|nr:hypothetical protein [uncultured marine virus]